LVEQEFGDFLRCGCLAGGFARFRCAACRLDRLVALSCKGRGFCPRCGGRRMAERNLILYYGVVAPRAAWRAALVPSVSSAGLDDSAVRHSVQVDDDSSRSVPPRFGADWIAYRQGVRRWVPQFRPWHRKDRPAALLFVAEGCGMCREVGRWFEKRGARPE